MPRKSIMDQGWAFRSDRPKPDCRSVIGLARFSGCGLQDQAQSHRAESHRARFFGAAWYKHDFHNFFKDLFQFFIKNTDILSNWIGLAQFLSGRDRAQLSQHDRAGNKSGQLGSGWKIGPGRLNAHPCCGPLKVSRIFF